MKYFWNIQMTSMMYAFIVFVPTQLMLNVYRINRMTKWDIEMINTLTFVMSCTAVIGGAILLIQLTKKSLGVRKIKYWTIVLWIPYFILLNYIFNHLFPITYGGDKSNPVTGLLIIAGLLIYPLYIFILNFVSTCNKQKIMGTKTYEMMCDAENKY